MAATEVSAINLKILSPSPEVENGISFTDLPASTTVRELRVRIQDAVPSKPAPERMRLIYRGRVVVNDADTLGGVFGADAVSHPLMAVTLPSFHADYSYRYVRVRTRASTWFFEKYLPVAQRPPHLFHALQLPHPIPFAQIKLPCQHLHRYKQILFELYHSPDQTHSPSLFHTITTIIHMLTITILSLDRLILSRSLYHQHFSNKWHSNKWHNSK